VQEVSGDALHPKVVEVQAAVDRRCQWHITVSYRGTHRVEASALRFKGYGNASELDAAMAGCWWISIWCRAAVSCSEACILLYTVGTRCYTDFPFERSLPGSRTKLTNSIPTDAGSPGRVLRYYMALWSYDEARRVAELKELIQAGGH
jgi:hypothetical protein